MKIPILPIAIIACFAIAATPVSAQRTKKKTTKKPAAVKSVSKKVGETSLVGVSLYDSGMKLIKMFGSPDEIQAVSIGSSGGGGGAAGGAAGGPGYGPGGPGGPPGAPGYTPPGRGPGGSGKPSPMGSPGMGFIGDSPEFLPDSLMQAGATAGLGPGAGGPSGGPAGDTPGGFGGPPTGMGGGAASTERATFTRWVYRRPTSRYAFILDKFSKVVQIEVIGLNDARCRTHRGIGLGATFGQIMMKYDQPDGYDIAGDSLVVRFLVHGKVAFRLARLEANKPHRVTGIVVAAGKS